MATMLVKESQDIVGKKIAGTRGTKLIIIGYATTTRMPAENNIN